MNIYRLSQYIENKYNKKVNKFYFDTNNVIENIQSLFWGVFLCFILSLLINVSATALICLTMFFYFLGTGLRKKHVNNLSFIYVNIKDFESFNLTTEELKNIIEAQRKKISYKDFFENNVNNFFIA